jgi:hypothetical protein
MNPTVAELFVGALMSSHQQGVALTNMADRNATQGLTVVNTSLIHQQGAVSDDPGLISALQTASRVPVQGSNDLPK